MEAEVTSYKPLTAQPEYLKLVAANLINRFGDSIDAIAIAWLMYEITHSAALMALILGLNYIPTILLQPFTGALVERMNKQRVMIVFDLARGFVVAAAAACYLFGFLTPALLTLMMLLISSLEAFRSPAGSAIVPMLLSKELYKVGSALNQTASRITELVGLALAGGVIALLGCQGALIIDAVTFFLSAFIIGLIRLKEDLPEEKVSLRSTAKSFFEGFQLIRETRVLVVLLLIGALMNFLFVPLNAYAAPFISDYLKGGAEVLSILNILLVAAMGLGSGLAPKITRMSGKTQLIVFGLVQSLALCAFAAGGYFTDVTLRYAVVLGSCVILGFSAGIINVVYNAAFLRLIPQDYMARLSGLSNAILVCSMPVGSFICSALAAVLPVPFAILVSGVMSILLYLSLTRVRSLEAL
ncbi:MAG: MFS transporter [Eubacteriales bacterium]|nr:MFS transporter [Eubacteriales bacterium]